MVKTFAILFPFFLQVLQFRLVHHLLHQVFLSTHAIAQVFGHVWNHVGYEGLDAKHQMLNKREDNNSFCFRNTSEY